MAIVEAHYDGVFSVEQQSMWHVILALNRGEGVVDAHLEVGNRRRKC